MPTEKAATGRRLQTLFPFAKHSNVSGGFYQLPAFSTTSIFFRRLDRSGGGDHQRINLFEN
jgi:hypothetical protein